MDIQNKTDSMAYKLKKSYQFVRLLRVEPFIFLTMFAMATKSVPNSQLTQDKICLFRHNLTADYCLALPTMTTDEDYLHMKSQIMKDVSNFSIISTFIAFMPSILSGLFIGQWTDTYKHAKKILLIAGALAGILEALILILNVYFFEMSEYVMLVASLPVALSGGVVALFCSAWAYVAGVTPAGVRAMRMTVTEIVSTLALPIGTYLGGLMLNTEHSLPGGQLYNYTLVYIVNAVCYTMALVWVIFLVDEEREFNEFQRRFPDPSGNGVVNEKLFADTRGVHPLKLLFNCNNVRDMFRTCLKKRDYKVRSQIWLILLGAVCYLMAHQGPGAFMFQFVQKIYTWDSEMNSNATAVNSIINALATIIVITLMIRYLNLKDTTMTIIGNVSYILQNLSRAFILSAPGFYVGIPLGSLGAAGSIGLRAHLSKIVEPQDLGKVFSLFAAIESLAPLAAILLFTMIFNATMDSYPGLSFILIAVICLIPIGVMLWIHFFTVMPDKWVKREVIQKDTDDMDSKDNLTIVTNIHV